MKYFLLGLYLLQASCAETQVCFGERKRTVTFGYAESNYSERGSLVQIHCMEKK